MTKAPPSAGRPRSEQRRRAILDAATDLFLALGYEATSMNEIVGRIGGSKATIYAHFENKQGLFAGVIDDLLADVLEPLYELDVGAMELRDGLLFLARRTVEVLSSEREIALQRLVFAESTRAPEIARLYYEHGPGSAHQHLEDYLRREQFADPAGAASYFWGMLLHQLMLQRHCRVVNTLTAGQIGQLVTRVVDDFLRLNN